MLIYTLPMVVDPSEIVYLLSKTHLFSNLDENSLSEIATQFDEMSLSENEIVYEEGTNSDSFYILFDGQLILTQKKKGFQKTLAKLVEGDFFGEEVLFDHKRHIATAKAVTDCILLRLNRVKLLKLISQIPDLKIHLQMSAKSRKLAGHKRWKWLGPNEVVYILVRKHTFFLYSNLILPGLAILAAIVFFVLFYYGLSFSRGTTTASMIGLIAGCAALIWAGWNILDWSNDYYIVTNQRVIWLEVIFGIYDSRHDTPLANILSVQTQSDQIGRVLGFGDVMVQTYTLTIPLRHVVNPKQFALIIGEHWRRSKEKSSTDEEETMDQVIRSKLGNEHGEGRPEDKPVQSPVDIKEKNSPGVLKTLLSSMFLLRFDIGDVVTYRKHWFVLLESTWKQILLIPVLIVLVFGRALDYYAFLDKGLCITLELLLLVSVFVWWLYDYVDWANDIYQVTSDEIVDIERKPLGRENKKTAPLDNILSIEYERKGILGRLFNFGTVYIKIGSITFAFNNVFKPSQVQQDIFRRKLELETKNKEIERNLERERFSAWLAAYHHTVGGQTPMNMPAVKDKDAEENEEAGDGDVRDNNQAEEDKDGYGWIG
jgi:hypothetical protein